MDKNKLTKAEFTQMLEDIKVYNATHEDDHHFAQFYEDGSQSDFKITCTNGIVFTVCEYFNIFHAYTSIKEAVESIFQFEDTDTLESWKLSINHSNL